MIQILISSKLAGEYGLEVLIESLWYGCLIQAGVACPLHLCLVNVSVAVSDGGDEDLVGELPRLDQGDHLGTQILHQTLACLEEDALGARSKEPIFIVGRCVTRLQLGQGVQAQQVLQVLLDAIALDLSGFRPCAEQSEHDEEHVSLCHGDDVHRVERVVAL